MYTNIYKYVCVYVCVLMHTDTYKYVCIYMYVLLKYVCMHECLYK